MSKCIWDHKSQGRKLGTCEVSGINFGVGLELRVLLCTHGFKDGWMDRWTDR